VAHAGFVRDAADWSLAVAARHGLATPEVNVGGGFGVDYTGESSFDLAALRGACRPRCAGVRAGPVPHRAAGWYAAEVLDLKLTQGRWFAVLRGGTHHFRLPAAWGYSHPFTVLPVTGGTTGSTGRRSGRWRWTRSGSCVRPGRADPGTAGRPAPGGDVLLFGNAGGYGWDISHHDFLHHPHPEMLVI